MTDTSKVLVITGKRNLGNVRSLPAPCVPADILIIDSAEDEDMGEYESFFKYRILYSKEHDIWRISREFFFKFVEETGIMESAMYRSYSLLLPFRWNIFLMLFSNIEFIEVLKYIFEKKKPSKVIIFNLPEKESSLILRICENSAIASEIVRTHTVMKLRMVTYERMISLIKRLFILLFHQHIMNPLSHCLLGAVGVLKAIIFLRCRKSRARELLMTFASQFQHCIRDGKVVNIDIIFESLLNEKGKYTVIIRSDCPFRGLKALFTQRWDFLQWEGFSLLYRWFYRKKIREERALYDRMIEEYLEKLQKMPEYREINMGDIWTEGLKVILKSGWSLELDAMVNEYIFRQLPFLESIHMTGETSGNYPALLACNLTGKKTYCYAHCLIYPYYMNYVFSPSEKGEIYPRCHIFYTWGKYELDFIGKNHIAYSVEVSGSPKIGLKNRDIYDRESVRKILGLKSQKPVVLFTSNKSGHMEARNFLKQYKDCKDNYHLIVKLHPREVDLQEFKRWARIYGIRDITIVRDFDFFALLSITSVLIGVASTTVGEAAGCGIPSIFFNSGLNWDQMEYIKMGAGFRLSDFDNLGEALKLMESEEFRRNYTEASHRFREMRFCP